MEKTGAPLELPIPFPALRLPLKLTHEVLILRLSPNVSPTPSPSVESHFPHIAWLDQLKDRSRFYTKLIRRLVPELTAKTLDRHATQW